ncbi:hypothetical protein D3C72_1884450 [compost metagenome]
MVTPCSTEYAMKCLMSSEPWVLHVEACAVAGNEQACLALKRGQFPVHEVACGLQFSSVEVGLAAARPLRKGTAGEHGHAQPQPSNQYAAEQIQINGGVGQAKRRVETDLVL